MKTETQREDWSSGDSEPSQHPDTVPPVSLLPQGSTNPEPPWEGVPWLPVREHHTDYLPARRDVGSGSELHRLPGCWSFPVLLPIYPAKALLQACETWRGQQGLCPLTGNGQMTIPGNRWVC